jgi:hypothetical protein
MIELDEELLLVGEVEYDSISGTTSDYNHLANKPKINDVELSDNKTLDELGIQAKEDGKGLTTNDFTNELLEELKTNTSKIEGLEAIGAQANVLENVKVNNKVLEVTDKTVNIPVPTDNSELANGAGYITGIDNNDVVTALGFTPYDSTNPNGYISEVSKASVTNALGFTPYDSTNPKGYQTASEVNTSINKAVSNIDLTDYVKSSELNNYITETELNEKGYLTSIPNTYADKSYVNSQISAAINNITNGDEVRY